MRTEHEQKLVDIILSDKYADTKLMQIKQAFIDEGWVKTEVDGARPLRTLDETVQILSGTKPRYAPDNRMTGPEWLARFEKEMEETQTIKRGFDVGDRIAAREAARRASGVDS